MWTAADAPEEVLVTSERQMFFGTPPRQIWALRVLYFCEVDTRLLKVIQVFADDCICGTEPALGAMDKASG